MAETLASTLNQGFDPLAISSRISSEKDITRRSQMAREARPEFIRQEREAEKAKAEAERQAKLLQITKEKELEESFEKGVSKPRETYQRALEEERPVRPESFNPNAGMELAAMTAVMGALTGLAGGGGRSALAALEGITEGYRLGQQDLYEKSLKDFDLATQERQQRITNAKAIYDLAMEKEIAKKNAGAIVLKQYAPELAGTVAGEHARLGDIKAFGEDVNAMSNLEQQIELKRFEAGLKPAAKPRFAQLKVEGTDREGNKKTLVFNPYDENFDPALMENPTPDTPAFVGFATEKSQQIGGREAQFAGRVQQALSSAGTEIMNVIKAPGLAEMPVFSGTIGRNPEGVFASLVALGARKATNEENRAFLALTSGISAALGRIESQGLANGTTLANLKAFDEMKPLAGDSPLVTALYLARLKQELEVGLGVYTTNRATTKEQRKEVLKRVQPVLDAINFEPADVLRAMQKSNAGRDKNLLSRSQRLINKPIGTITDTPQDLTSRLTIGNDPAAIQIRSDLANKIIDLQTARAQLQALGYE